MTDGLRKSQLRKAPQVGLSEVGLPEGNPTVQKNLGISGPLIAPVLSSFGAFVNC